MGISEPENTPAQQAKKFGYTRLMVFFGLIGVLALLGVLLTLFSSWGQRPDEVRATARLPVGSADFIAAAAGVASAPVREGGSALLLSNGIEFFPALLQDIRSAQRSINFMVYIWEPGDASDAVIGALADRARAGVQVRVLLDGVGALNTPDDEFRQLRGAGAEVARFRPLHVRQLARFHKRNHRRAIVIDGKIAYTGGASVADEWLGNADRPEHWRETMVRGTGPLASSLQAAFAQIWAGTTGEILVGDAYFPVHPRVSSTGEPVQRHISVVSSPSDASHPLRSLVWFSLACAAERLYITSSYFVPDEEIRQVLAERARTGVDVRILVPGEYTDVPPVRWAGQRHYSELLGAGVRIYEYQPTMIHSKTLVVDGLWAVVGSANLDIRSQELNQENVLGIQDRSFGTELERTFLQDLTRAREIRVEEWQRRPWHQKLREQAAALFEEQF